MNHIELKDKIIFVGDMHVKPDNLDESIRFIKWLKEFNVNNLPILFAGDQYNDHGVIKVEIFYFWRWALDFLQTQIISLVGNHDFNSDGLKTIMIAHKYKSLIVDKPVKINNILFLPYYKNNEEFLSNLEDARFLFCHQDFNGAMYENGFYSPNGVDPEKIKKYEKVFSGHIHKEQYFSNINYLGTPRHLTRSDIGEKKGIFIIDLLTGQSEKFLTPTIVCEPFQLFKITEENKDIEIPNSSKVYIDVIGNDIFIKKILKTLPIKAKIRTFIESNTQTIQIKESDGLAKSFSKYKEIFFKKYKINKDKKNKIIETIYNNIQELKE